jgi:hypothetical protein
MRFQGVHRVWPKSGWLLSYGLKGVSAAMVARLARFLMACNGGNEFARASVSPWSRQIQRTKNDEQYQKYQLLIILQEKARLRHGTSAIVAT